MKTYLFIPLTISLVLITLCSSGQRFTPGDEMPPARKEQWEKIESFRIAYFTEKLDLSPAEAETFWPLYNEYRKTMELNSNEGRRRPGNDLEPDPMTDQEALAIVDKAIRQIQERSKLTQQFFTSLKQVLPPKKIVLFLDTERSFKHELLRKLEQYRSREKK